MGPIQNIHEALSWVRRRWSIFGITGVIGAVIGLIMAMNAEVSYQATAVIQVVNPVIAVDDEGAGAGAAVTDVTRRVQGIEQRIMSRDALLALGERYGLFEGTALSSTERVGLMRESFSISSIAAAQQGFARDGSLSALIISAANDDPQRAADIANELANAIVQQSIDERQDTAQQALDFFLAEEARLESAINTLENENAAFLSENEAFLPAAVAARRDEQGRLSDSLLELNQEISALQAELATLDTNSRRAVTQRRIEQINDLTGRLREQSTLITNRIAEIQEILLRAPEIEQQILATERRMEQLQSQLSSAAASRRDAELGARIEVDQQAERFELLESALVPEFPVSRSRKVVALMGLIGGLFVGIVLAYALEWFNPVMRTSQRMERDLDLRPVVSIPYTMSLAEQRRRQRIWMLGIGVLIAGLVAVAFLMGLF